MKRIIAELHQVFNDDSDAFRRKVVGLYVLLIIFNVAAWGWAITAFAGNAVLLGAAVLAYSFGLRHAFDADHIASIDTVTRKLMQQKKRPTTVGLHFAIGHSLALVVFVTLIAATVAWGSSGSKSAFIDSAAGVASTVVSASFLLAMAVLNLGIAKSTYRTFRHVRNGGTFVEEDFNVLLNKRGFFSRIFRPLFRVINKSWHMISIGFLFGLGFDTATEVTLLGIAGAEAAKGVSIWLILVFPTLFAAGMSLMDTTDSVLMVRAYDWALRNPIRKLYYNLTITVVSAMVAIAVAGIEVLALMSQQLRLNGELWDAANALNSHWEGIGIFVVALFVISWGISVILYRVQRYDQIEVAVAPVLKA